MIGYNPEVIIINYVHFVGGKGIYFRRGYGKNRQRENWRRNKWKKEGRKEREKDSSGVKQDRYYV